MTRWEGVGEGGLCERVLFGMVALRMEKAFVRHWNNDKVINCMDRFLGVDGQKEISWTRLKREHGNGVCWKRINRMQLLCVESTCGR